ncbi:MAG: zinc ribbon domain-containing protein [Candidatus Lokiarchaeota archaeon]|nr:zinc ribbon domain-containing protein [Candidatus Harpocratesius repetitus]
MQLNINNHEMWEEEGNMMNWNADLGNFSWIIGILIAIFCILFLLWFVRSVAMPKKISGSSCCHSSSKPNNEVVGEIISSQKIVIQDDEKNNFTENSISGINNTTKSLSISFCTNCGNRIESQNIRFCPNCGTELN